MFDEFKAFISKGNVLDLAVGVIIGAAFGKIVSSLTEDLTMAQIGDLVERTMREYDEADPTLESYQKYRP